MECFLCDSNMTPYFDKQYETGIHHFVKCPPCGLVINRTVYEMSVEEWKKENDIHRKSQGIIDLSDPVWEGRINRLQPQAELIAMLFKEGLFSSQDKIVDWGGGIIFQTRQ